MEESLPIFEQLEENGRASSELGLASEPATRPRLTEPLMVPKSALDDASNENLRLAQQLSAAASSGALQQMPREELSTLVQTLSMSVQSMTMTMHTMTANMNNLVGVVGTVVTRDNLDDRLRLEQERLELERSKVEEDRAEKTRREQDRLKKTAEAEAKAAMDRIPEHILSEIKRLVDSAGRKHRAHLKANKTIDKATQQVSDLSHGKLPAGIPRYTPPWDWKELDSIADGSRTESDSLVIQLPKDITRREAIRKINIASLHKIKQLEVQATKEHRENMAEQASLNKLKLLVNELELKSVITVDSNSNSSSKSPCCDKEIWKKKAESLWQDKIAMVERDLVAEEQSADKKAKSDAENKKQLDDLNPCQQMENAMRRVATEVVDQRAPVSAPDAEDDAEDDAEEEK